MKVEVAVLGSPSLKSLRSLWTYSNAELEELPMELQLGRQSDFMPQ